MGVWLEVVFIENIYNDFKYEEIMMDHNHWSKQFSFVGVIFHIIFLALKMLVWKYVSQPIPKP